MLPIRTLRRLGIVTSSLDEAQFLSRCALFHGDIPGTHRSPAVGRLDLPAPVEGVPPNFVCSAEYMRPRPTQTLHRDVLYTPGGFAWKGHRVDIALSAHSVRSSRRLLADRLQRRGLTIARGTIIESQSPHTYGDWTTEQMKSIALCPDFPQPLVLPAALAARSYVRSELGRLGIEILAADRPVLIREAVVLHKPCPLTLWRPEDVAAYRKLFGIVPPMPRPGSILYLSRLDVRSEQTAAARDYRSATIAKIVSALGGRVVETGRIGRDDYAVLADEAETVIADHGSAVFNILQWNTRNLIEIVTDNWWSRSLLFLGVACGVANHALVRCDGRSEGELAEALQHHLRAFGVPLSGGGAEAAPTAAPPADPR